MRICFVTPEFAPFTAGGIGQLIANVIAAHAARDEIHVLLDDRETPSQTVTLRAGTARLWRLADWADDPPERPRLSPWQRASERARLALRRLANANGPFDWIEFPDYAGLAHATLQDRLMGRAFTKTGIAVRLHSTVGVLRPVQHRPPSADWLWLIDQERKALREADVIVAHLASVAFAVRAHYGFGEEFLARTRIEPPPSSPDSEPALEAIRFTAETPLAFVTKLQDFKRPEVFLKGASAFLRARPDYRGAVIVCAAASEADVIARVRAQVPEDLSHRIRIDLNPPAERRKDLIARSVVVIPSAYESYCLAAHEAAAAGAILVVNGGNPAFAPTTPWRDGRTCCVFDGTARDLARQLARLWDDRDGDILVPIGAAPVAEPYWRSEPKPPPHVDPPPLSLASATNDLNAAIDCVASDLILIEGPNDRADPAFVAQARRALARHPDYAAVVPAGGGDVLQPLGEAPATGLFANALGGSTYLVRADWVRALGFDENLTALRDWDFLLRLTMRGARFIAPPGPGYEAGARPPIDPETTARELGFMRGKHALNFPGGAVNLSILGDGLAVELAPLERDLKRARRRPLANLWHALNDRLRRWIANRSK